MAQQTRNFGFVAVPRDPAKLFGPNLEKAPKPKPLSVEEIKEFHGPESELVLKSKEYLKPILGEQTFHHSERVFLLGSILVESLFPDVSFDKEAYHLACLFHDFGCVSDHIEKTKMSFEYWGAIKSREWLLSSSGGNQPDGPLIDGITECIIRHTNFVPGQITIHGLLIHLATLLDNVGANVQLIDPDSYKNLCQIYSRHGWSNCFGDAMQKEADLKPWSHTTALVEADDFINGARNNAYGNKLE